MAPPRPLENLQQASKIARCSNDVDVGTGIRAPQIVMGYNSSLGFKPPLKQWGFIQPPLST